MSRPTTPEGIRAEAEELAKGDIERHRKYNHDLNVFSTQGGRDDWQRGFDNAEPRSWARTVEYDTFYQRGRAVARLLEQERLTQIVKETVERLPDVTVVMDRNFGTVSIEKPEEDDIFMQGEDADRFIAEVDKMYEEAQHVTEDEAALCCAHPYCESIWS